MCSTANALWSPVGWDAVSRPARLRLGVCRSKVDHIVDRLSASQCHGSSDLAVLAFYANRHHRQLGWDRRRHPPDCVGLRRFRRPRRTARSWSRGRTVDGGQSWHDVTPPGGGILTFHDMEAFDGNQVLVLAVGSGQDSKIFRTADGGASWELVFENKQGHAFYDGIAFFDPAHGIALSDPVAGKFCILATGDGGRTWQVASTNGMPPALHGEFAHATGTCPVTNGPHDAWFGTRNSRVFHTSDGGLTWSVVTTPIPGDPQFGIASLAFRDTQHGLALGGSAPGTPTAPSVVAATADGGTTWSQVGSPAGFRLNMALVRDTAVAVGFTGSDFSTDDGQT
jgi:photosystem II stability/assembly factor-like uncharacterized protein